MSGEENVWRWVKDWGDGWLTEVPPERPCLLELCETIDWKERRRPILPLGKPGMVAGPGGSGKSWAMTQLAVCVATGRKWLNTFDVVNPGPVLLALAEEDIIEIRRRLYWSAERLGLSDEERTKAAANILTAPLMGRQVTLDTTSHEIEGFAKELLQQLGRDVRWRLIILDPLSRFGGRDVECDNHAATLFVIMLEALTKASGKPTVLVTHHTNQTSRMADDGGRATDARGVTALTDAIRWMANLTPVKPVDVAGLPDLMRLRITKNNYGASMNDLWLCPSDSHQGALRLATKAELEEYNKALEQQKAEDRRKKREKRGFQKLIDHCERELPSPTATSREVRQDGDGGKAVYEGG